MSPAIPTLCTPRLTLRALTATDLDRFAAFNANADVTRYLGAGTTRTRAETWSAMTSMLGQWALRGYGMLAITERGSDLFIGRAGLLHPYEWPEPELAYGLDQPYWGHGYATEAAAALRTWMFETHAPPRLISYVRPGNTASTSVLRKLGATRGDDVDMMGQPAELWVHTKPGKQGSAGQGP